MTMTTESPAFDAAESTQAIARRGRVLEGATRFGVPGATGRVSRCRRDVVDDGRRRGGLDEPRQRSECSRSTCCRGGSAARFDVPRRRRHRSPSALGAGLHGHRCQRGRDRHRYRPGRRLSGPGKLVAAVDFSDERTDPSTTFVDNFGHGTHLAGIIAGRSPDADPAVAAEHPEWFLGVAPDAGIVSVKVAGRDGSLSPAALISGIDWVIANADDLDIRVINLAFDGASSNARTETELAAAVERAWNAGIVVVTAAGNGGADSGGLAAPASDPYVIAVGGLEATDDGFVVADFTSRGDGVRNPDIAAPGAHIESLRAPGSYADVEHPEGFVDQQRFLASGSSQAAAVAAGVAALLLDENPALTPDQVKAAMVASATYLAGVSHRAVGAGVISTVDAASVAPTTSVQTWEPILSSGPLPHVPGTVIDLQPTSSAWASSAWASSAWASSAWASSAWASSAWASSAWASSAWASSAWASSAWASSAWASSAWASSAWASSAWASSAWASSAWASSAWASSACGRVLRGRVLRGRVVRGRVLRGRVVRGRVAAWASSAWASFCVGEFCVGEFCVGEFCVGEFCVGEFCVGE